MLEDNLKKNFLAKFARKKSLTPNGGKVLLFWSPTMASMTSIVAKSQQKQTFIFFLSLSLDARSPGKHDAAASGRKRLLQTRM